MLHIRFILPKTTKGLKQNEEIDEEVIYREAQKILNKNTPNVEVFFYKNKNLYINCSNSIIANELFLNQDKIIEEINQFFKRKTISRLIIKVK